MCIPTVPIALRRLLTRTLAVTPHQCRGLLGMPPPAEPPTDPDYRDRYEELTGISLHQCPQCKQGQMLVAEILPRCPYESAPSIDSS